MSAYTLMDTTAETLTQELHRVGVIYQGRWMLAIDAGAYVMQDARDLIGGPRHTLDMASTDDARLEAHWSGFVATNSERYGR